MPFSNFSGGVLENFGGVRTPLHPPENPPLIIKTFLNDFNVSNSPRQVLSSEGTLTRIVTSLKWAQ
jgi:adenylylsulfate kinase-like enzyme